MKIQPVIKWSGSKRSQAGAICSEIPNFNRYYEPFVGGGSITYALAPPSAIAGDICVPLIDLWNEIKYRPTELAARYRLEWEQLQTIGSDHYYSVRTRFNKESDPADLLFLSRTCVNGLIRFNSDGKFNNSFHLSRPGIHPDRLDRIIRDWAIKVQGVDFLAAGYRESTDSAVRGDFVYMDPPYANTKGRYYGTSSINFEDFFVYLDELNRKGIKWALSFDGSRGDVTYKHGLPEDIYRRRLSIESGTSTFRRVLDKELEKVHESLYLSY